MVKKRDEFGDPVKRQLANRVACFCSNPSCRVSTHGPHTDPGKARTIGKAGHITAAAAGGPRYDASLTREQRRSAQNGIWVCSSCHDLVDGDELRYPVEMLREWKKLAEEYAAQFIGKRLVPDAESVLTLARALARIELGVQSLASGSNDIDDALDDAKTRTRAARHLDGAAAGSQTCRAPRRPTHRPPALAVPNATSLHPPRSRRGGRGRPASARSVPAPARRREGEGEPGRRV